MAREILQFRHKMNMDPKNNTYRSRQIIGTRSLSLVYLSEMGSDGSQSVRLTFTRSISVLNYDDPALRIKSGETVSLTAFELIVIQSDTVSKRIADQRIVFAFFDANGSTTWTAEVDLTVLGFALMGDFDRDGKVDSATSAAKQWSWGPNGRGAILLVNSDRDSSYPSPHFRDRLDRRINGALDLADMTPLRIEFSGPRQLDLSGYTIRIHASDAAASRVRIFDVTSEIPEILIEPGSPVAKLLAHYQSRELAIEGIDYPDAGFSGLISITMELEEKGVLYADDKVVLRVAPWLALPNTQPARRAFIVQMQDNSNAATITDFKSVCAAAGVELVIVSSANYRSDRWLQDEIEIGYAQRPGKRLAVVLDSPRDRGLDDFPERTLLGPDFGYVTRGNDEVRSSLDSFGNLDCTPPHIGPYGPYPFGRTLFGGAQPGSKHGRRMMKVVSDFLYAQQVQFPIELFSDWLFVGHVDEFMSFVPAHDGKGFRLLLASPHAAFQLLEGLRADGHHETKIFEGKRHEQLISELLDDQKLRRENDRFQQYIDWNRLVLIREMGLSASDIVDLPALYFVVSPDGRAGAYFPGMVNMQILNDHLAIPKPFGPRINGQCALESHVRTVLEPLGLTCHFVDTYQGYHLQHGEIHCGTNVEREPFASPWWHFDPEVNQQP